MEQSNAKKKKVKAVAVIAIIVVASVVFGALWLFTPFGFWGLSLDGEYKVKITVGEHEMTATMENNTSSMAFKRMLMHGAKTVNMRDYGGMEKVGMLWKGLSTNNEQITTDPGDIILFKSSSLVVYYNPNSWNFTKMGHINDVPAEELRDILGSGNVSMTFELIE